MTQPIIHTLLKKNHLKRSQSFFDDIIGGLGITLIRDKLMEDQDVSIWLYMTQLMPGHTAQPSYGESLRFIFRTRKVCSDALLHATHTWWGLFSEAAATDRGRCASSQSVLGLGGGGGWDRDRTQMNLGVVYVHVVYMDHPKAWRQSHHSQAANIIMNHLRISVFSIIIITSPVDIWITWGTTLR